MKNIIDIESEKNRPSAIEKTRGYKTSEKGRKRIPKS